MRLAAMLTLLATFGPATASASPCGTVIVPSGIGSSEPSPVNTLHPILSSQSAYEQQAYALLYRPVVWTNGAYEFDQAESLAQSIDVEDGGAAYRVTLKPYLWSDGKPVTADDVLYCWQMISAIGRAYVDYGSGGIPLLVRGFTVLGPHQFEIKLTRAVSPDWFELAGLTQFFALPRHAWGRYSIAEQRRLQSTVSFYDVVDGPFRLTRLQLGRYAAFAPNPLYGGHQATIARFITTFLEGTDQLAALTAGDVDMANLPFPVWNAANRIKGFRKVTTEPAADDYVIIPNLRNKSVSFLDDVRVRQAISMAISQKDIVTAVFHGHSRPDRSFIPPTMRDYLPPDIRDGHPPLDDDPARARTLLDEAGWRTGPDGVRTKGGKRLAFDVLVTAGNAERLEMLQLADADLAKVGVEIQIRELAFTQLFGRLFGPSDSWQAAVIGQSIEYYPDGTLFFGRDSTENFSHYENPEMDRLLDAQTGRPGKQATWALDDFVERQQPMIFLPAGTITVLARPGIEGVRKFIDVNKYLSPEYLTLHGAMACR